MKTKNELIVVLSSAIIFTILFYKQHLGINLFIFESLILSWLFLTKQLIFTGKTLIALVSGLVITAVAVIFVYSDLAIMVNFLLLFLLAGILIYPAARSFINVLALSISNILGSAWIFLNKLIHIKVGDRGVAKYVRRLSFFIIPLAIIVLFIFLYSLSNPVFNNITGNISDSILKYLDLVFGRIDGELIIVFILGLCLSTFLLLRAYNSRFIEIDKNASYNLIRKRQNTKRNFRNNDLKNELKVAVFLLLILNLLILLLNSIDIYWVWFNFEWNGQYLKQFVQEGTYLLILSILISIVIVLFFFRRNLNFYSRNQLLKYLSYAWLIQNGILIISVAIRNFWYIHYFSLAYKRIGVIVFLILTLYGLYTVALKVKQRKSAFYLLTANSFVLIVILIACSVFNWDNIIAKYNFRNYKQSFVHFDYLASLSDKSLPFLDKPLTELEAIGIQQKNLFPFEESVHYMSPSEYYKIIEQRKSDFKKSWESKSFLSWNYPEYKAYNELFSYRKNQP